VVRFLIAFLILLVSPLYADVYVSTTGDDSTGNGTIGSPYLTIQTGVNALKAQGPGNTLYLRGGTYTTLPYQDDGVRGVKYATLNNATASNWYRIRSYPGEWAIIDASEYDDNRVFVFYVEASTGNVGMTGYIEFSHMEIKGVNAGTHAAAIAGNGGPLAFRYLYIHDNVCATGDNNPGGIRLGNGTGDSIIEYCYLYRNAYLATGSSMIMNSGNIVMMSDYKYTGTFGNQKLHNASGYSTARHNNHVRYNLIVGGPIDGSRTGVAIREKAPQYLASATQAGDGQPEDVNSWSDQGNHYHHNIILNHLNASIATETDFNQIYNNIIHNSGYAAVEGHERNPSSNRRGPWRQVYYNNTAINSGRGAYTTYSFYVGSTYPDPIYEEIWMYNNISDNASQYDGIVYDFSVCPKYSSYNVDWDINNKIKLYNNYIYRSQNTPFSERITRRTTAHAHDPLWQHCQRRAAALDDRKEIIIWPSIRQNQPEPHR